VRLFMQRNGAPARRLAELFVGTNRKWHLLTRLLGLGLGVDLNPVSGFYFPLFSMVLPWRRKRKITRPPLRLRLRRLNA